MKKLSLIVALVAVAMPLGCKKKPTAKSKSGAETTEMAALPKQSKKLECIQKYKPKKFSDGKVRWCTLKADYTVGPYTCKKGKHIEFNVKNRKLVRCTLRTALKIDGHECAAKEVQFHFNGKLDYCHLVQSKKYIGAPCKDKTAFHRKTGSLSYCKLAGDATLGGFPCKGGRNASFSEEGKLYLCYAAKEVVAGGAKIPAGSKIQPYGRKNIEYAEASSGKIIKFHAYKCKEMHFKQSGEAKKCKLAATVKIGDKELSANKWICFDKSGKPANGSGCEKL